MVKQQVRQTIKRGTTQYATVEESHNGLTTVRLTANGKRLSNLASLGDTITANQKVIVDYSTGIPIVHPIYDQITETVLEILEPFVKSDPVIPIAEDVGVYARIITWGDEWMMYKLQPLTLSWSINSAEEWYYGAIYDTHNHLTYTEWMGQDHVEVKVTGKYLIEYGWDMVEPNYSYDSRGSLQIQIYCNNTLIAENYNIPDCDAAFLWGGELMSQVFIYNLQKGDKLYYKILDMEITADIWRDDPRYLYTTYYYNTRLAIQLLPGTGVYDD